jgi:predicted DNA-binding protein with PD1-like motif
MSTVTEELARRNVKSGAIVSLIGAIDRCVISNMPARDPKSDILTEYCQPFEMSGTGEISDGKPHIHCVLGREGDVSLAGHLHSANVETWFVNVYVAEMLLPGAIWSSFGVWEGVVEGVFV